MKSSGGILLISSLVAILLVGGLVLFNKNKQDTSLTLPIVVEEFADFQCPACKAYDPLVNRIKAEFPAEEVQVVYKHFPLMEIHDRAYAAALASEAARKQDKFEEYNDKLFAEQPNFSDEELAAYAEELGMNKEQFMQDYASAEAKMKVDAEIAEGKNRSVNGTPTFFINGKEYPVTGRTPDDMYNYIQELVNKAKANASTSNTETQN